MPVEETSNSVTLVDVAGERHVILRKNLEELIRNDRSHMPEGLEAKMDLQQMTDLFAFIQKTTGAPRKEVDGNQPALVTAQEDGSLRLLANSCEIYGSSRIAINVRMGCLAWMSATDDRAIWSVGVPVGGPYEIWLNWAQIDTLDGNPFALEVQGASQRMTGNLASTGGWQRYRKAKFGVLELPAGIQRIVLLPNGPINEELAEIREIHLVPVK